MVLEFLYRKKKENLKSEIEVAQFGYFTAVEGERCRYICGIKYFNLGDLLQVMCAHFVGRGVHAFKNGGFGVLNSWCLWRSVVGT